MACACWLCIRNSPLIFRKPALDDFAVELFGGGASASGMGEGGASQRSLAAADSSKLSVRA